MKAEEIDDFDTLLETAEEQAEKDWDVNFVSDLRDKYEQYRDNLYVSDAQLEQLERIAG
jgi:hypothetical protein